jgi:8-oxo-dGTP diphosphatase
MKKKFTYEYERPALTVDCVIFGFDEINLKVLLIKRGIKPFKNKWALPGGFVKMTETTEQAANRILKKETSIKGVFMEQLYTFSDVERDPRERIISASYFALVKPNEYQVIAGDDEISAEWFNINELPELAFDHKQIVETAHKRLKGKIRYQSIGFELLPEKFKLSQLQNLYEVILETKIDRRNFQKKIKQMDILLNTEEKEKNVAHKAATLYKFNKDKKQDNYSF